MKNLVLDKITNPQILNINYKFKKMKTNYLLLILIFALFSCTNQSTEQKTEETEVTTETTDKSSAIKNYAIVWDWTTEGHAFIMENLKEQSEDFQKLFDQGIIENVYLNNYEIAQVNENAKIATIMFFIKAENEKEARVMLDDMKFIKTHVAKYRLYPVGEKWLGRHETADANKKFSFAAVWNHSNNKEMIEKHVKAQFEQTIGLWNEGIIENAYFATENAYENMSKVPGMVYFVNADNEEEAKNILDNMIFAREGISTYQLFPVGTFWLGSK